MVIRTLTAADFDAVFIAFNEAFSDYLVPLTLTREQLAEMLRRRGWVPEVSVAAFEGERMVAFTLNAIEEARAYDSGTGVVPSHRRQGLAKQMMERSFELLRGSTYVLEVLEQNDKAVALYRSLGFRETRKLQCWRYEGPGVDAPANGRPHEEWWDIQPSWQNSTSALSRAGDRYTTVGDERGYAIVFPSNGDLPQLAVSREARRQGLGTQLLRAAARVAGKPIRILNIDHSHAGIAAFLEAAGATKTVRQLEMERNLSC